MLDDSCGSLLRKNDLYLYYHVCMHWETERKKKRLGDLGVTNEPSILVIVVERVLFFLPFSNKCRKDRRECPPMPSATDPICPLFQVAPIASALALTGTASIWWIYERSFSTRSVWQIDLLVIFCGLLLFVCFLFYAWYVLFYRKGNARRT